MDDTLFQRMKAHVENNEGRMYKPYKINGQLTTGVGFKVTDADAFAGLPFQVKDAKTGKMRYATDVEMRQEFERIKSMSKNDLARDQNAFQLTGPDIDAKLKSEIEGRIDKVKGEVGADNWDKLNDGQKTAILDIHYANGSLKGFPNLKQAIKDGDAEGIGKNVDFNSGGAYNWERVIRNRAEAQGISLEDARRQVEGDKRTGAFGLQHQRPEPRPQQQDAPPTTEREQPEPAPQSAPQQPVPQPEAPKPQVSGETGSTPAQEQKQSEAPADPRVASLVEMASPPPSPTPASQPC